MKNILVITLISFLTLSGINGLCGQTMVTIPDTEGLSQEIQVPNATSTVDVDFTRNLTFCGDIATFEKIGDPSSQVTIPMNSTTYSAMALDTGSYVVSCDCNSSLAICKGGYFTLNVVVTPVTVPTLGEWGIIFLFIILVIFGVVTLRSSSETDPSLVKID